MHKGSSSKFDTNTHLRSRVPLCDQWLTTGFILKIWRVQVEQHFIIDTTQQNKKKGRKRNVADGKSNISYFFLPKTNSSYLFISCGDWRNGNKEERTILGSRANEPFATDMDDSARRVTSGATDRWIHLPNWVPILSPSYYTES